MPVYRRTTSLGSGIPLGGLGTGSVELREDGRFHDWEIFNNGLWSGSRELVEPEMGSEDAFFAVRTRAGNGPARVRLLYDDDKRQRAAAGWHDHALIYLFPFLRNVAAIEYSGRHPFARLRYEDPGLPVGLEMKAFTPFVPFQEKDSALPLAFFVFRAANTGPEACEVSLMFSLRNMAGYELETATLEHDVVRAPGLAGLRMGAPEMDAAARTAGTMFAGVLGGEDGVTMLPAWTDGRGLKGFPDAATPGMSHWAYPLRETGRLEAGAASWRRTVKQRAPSRGAGVLHDDRAPGRRWRGAVCRSLRLEPGQEAEAVFVMAWHFPNHHHYFTGERLGHMYENWFSDAEAVARHGAAEFGRLRGESERFAEGLYAGTLPAWLCGSCNAQLTSFPQTFWWTKSGELTAWEGSACCQTIPNCHTLWSSWQPLLFFPEAYLAMKRRSAAFGRETECAGEGCWEPCDSAFLRSERERRSGKDQSKQKDLGGWFAKRWRRMGYAEEDFRRQTSPEEALGAVPLLVSAVQLLRDYQWTGDRALVEQMWPAHRERYLGQAEACAKAGGLPQGRISFLTYDHWFPPAANCYLGTILLSEFRAAAELARVMGDADAARGLDEAAARGAARFEALYWNGEYYRFCHDAAAGLEDEGCLADQVSGHLALRLCGLAAVHDEARVRAALGAVFRHNRVPECGLVNGSDPRGRNDWRYFARYSEEGADEALAGQWVTPWTGTEYYVAGTMIAEGLVEEGLAVARDVWERHAAAGMVYNHIECGEHYFRAMAVWTLLPALQGLVWRAAEGFLEVAPRWGGERFASVLLLPGVGGRLEVERGPAGTRVRILVEAGRLEVRTLRFRGRARERVARVGGEAVAARFVEEGEWTVVELGGKEALVCGRGLEIGATL